MERPHHLELERAIPADVETIFSFWTDPDRLVRWMGRRAEIEASLGGLFIVDLTGDDIVLGRVVLIEPPSRLELAWGWGGEREPSIDPGSSRVALTLESGRGSTTIRLTHRDVPPSHLGWQAKFWQHHLDRLKLAAIGEPVPEPSWSPGKSRE
jgi:uncharacterized protein YndB with AHSA1/START domain